MHPILQKFIQAEEGFLTAASTDNQALADFTENWQTLQSDWESYVHEADHGTQQLVAKIVAKVQELAGDVYLVESLTMSLKDGLLTGIEDMFMSLSLEDDVQKDQKSSDAVDTALGDHRVVSPAQWLLQNLHNPYPLPHVHFSSTPSGSKCTKDWFGKARQRIGWTRLLRDRFAGCRSLAIEAAFRAFIRDDPANPLDADLKTAFSAIKSHAELVFGKEHTIPHSPPKRLRSISPTPSLTFSSGSEDTDDEQHPTPSSEYPLDRPSKRECLGPLCSPLPKRRRMHQLPSPTLQTKENPLVRAEVTPIRSKKRRLSESDQDGSSSKRPRGVEGNRLLAPSDPLPIITPVWLDLNQSFQMPNPASTDPLEPCSFDLDFFDPPSLPPCIAFPTPVPTIDPVASEANFSSLFEIPQLDLLQSELPTFDSHWSEFLNFDPDLSPFPLSPSLMSSSTSTPSLADDAILSPFPSPEDSSLISPLGTLPYLSDKSSQLQTLGEPIIQGQDFLLSPGETAGIPSASALLSVC